MIFERHYDDETLIGLLSTNPAETVRDPHLSICSSCSESLASYRAISSVLGEEAAWDLRDLRLEPVPATITALRSFAAAAADSEEVAAEALATLLALPEDQWLPAVTADGEMRTPAVVAALVTESEKILHNVPLRSLAAARLAARVAEMLPPDAYPRDVVARARGAAGRQLAYAAFYTGDFPLAVEALEPAQKALETCVVNEYDLARLAIVRTLVFSAQERYTEAMAEARRAAATFEAFGDRSRYAAARVAEAFALMSQHRWREAFPILEMVETRYGADLDNDSRANVLANLALCHGQLGNVSEALNHYPVASAIYEEIGNVTEAVRTRYNIADLLAQSGRHKDAKVRFREVHQEFTRLGMTDMAVAAGLGLAELLIAENAFAEAESLCLTALEQIERAGLSTTTPARTALSFLREAAASRRATPETVRHVRSYITRLPSEPALLFAPPPLGLD